MKQDGCPVPGRLTVRSRFHLAGSRLAARPTRHTTMAKKKATAKKAATPSKPRSVKASSRTTDARCGLCGKTRNLTRTECCGHWICDDEHKYVAFSFSQISCSRNHRRYTLCGFHSQEGHAGDWKTCRKCRKAFQPELYVYFGTNEHNFEVLPNPPDFEPTTCVDCGKVIMIGTEEYSLRGKEHYCSLCTLQSLMGDG